MRTNKKILAVRGLSVRGCSHLRCTTTIRYFAAITYIRRPYTSLPRHLTTCSVRELMQNKLSIRLLINIGHGNAREDGVVYKLMTDVGMERYC
jgi:hypothetical protein